MKSVQYTGLTDKHVAESREKNGLNILTPPKKESLLKLYFQKFDDPIIKILLVATLLSLIIGFINNEYIEPIGIIAAIFIATTISFWFEYDAFKKFEILNKVNDDTLVKVLRNDVITEVPKRDVVVGDVVFLNNGDEVPADGKLLSSISLQVDESNLTGEPIVSKSMDKEDFDPEITYPSDELLRGSKVVDGSAVMKVLKVGDLTEYGKVAIKSTEIVEKKTPLSLQLERLANLIGLVGFLVASLTFFVLVVKNILLEEISFSKGQLFLSISVLISLAILLIKVWYPIVSNGLREIKKRYFKNASQSDRISNIPWYILVLISAVILFIAFGISFLFGNNPVLASSWPNLVDIEQVLKYFMISVTLIVVTVPEGLPMSVTLSLALSMKRMLKTNNLVRKMHATETLGATTVICTDKTGTLTENRMRVDSSYFFGNKDIKLSDDEISILIKENIALNSTAHLDYTDVNSVKTVGNPTESALLLWLEDQNVKYLDVKNKAKLEDQLSFSTERKYMASVVYSEELKKKVLYVKGAPEIVLDMSSSIITENGKSEIKDEIKTKMLDVLVGYQSKAMRTLGFAYEIIEDDKDRIKDDKIINSNLSYLGFVAISDPLRGDVKESIDECLRAGIRIIMVTGDTIATAKEIGRQIGIINTDEDLILRGTEFEAMSDKEIIDIISNIKILCRARPNDKQRLVELLQETGEVVAVTGDGTNDAPALNYASVGLSMGSGTSVAKEASDITILDDSFKSIGSAVMWGRSLYKNIQRFLLFQLIINLAAMVIVFVGSIFDNELPLTITQMLWVNLIMDTFAAIALASLPPDPSVMKEKPRKNKDFIISNVMAKTIISVSSIFVIILFTLLYLFRDSYGIISEYNLSLFFTIFVMMQFWNLFNARAFASSESSLYKFSKSYGFILILIFIFIGQIIIVEFGGKVFRTVPLKLIDWLIVVGSTSLVFIIGELIRFISRQKNKKIT